MNRNHSSLPPLIALAAVLLGGAPCLEGQVGEDEETETTSSRAEELLALIRQLEEGARHEAPSVLADVDPKRASVEVLRAARILKSTTADLSIEGQSLDATLKLLRVISGLNFVMSAKARAAAAAAPPVVNLTVKALPLENVLNLLSLSLGDYRFVIRHGAVTLIHNDEYRPRLSVRMYQVADLVRPRPNFKAPTLGLGSLKE